MGVSVRTREASYLPHIRLPADPTCHKRYYLSIVFSNPIQTSKWNANTREKERGGYEEVWMGDGETM